MKVLLDTHIVLWAATEPERLGAATATIEDGDNELLVSAASSWEIAIKYSLNKLPLPEPPDRYVPHLLRALDARPVAVEHTHALAVAGLPRHHRDPFDRLLVVQAQALDVPIVTADGQLSSYEVGIVSTG